MQSWEGRSNWKNQPLWLQIILQSYSHQDSMVLAQKQKYRPMEQDRKTRDTSVHPCEGSGELNNWCFWTVVLEKTLESPLDCKEIQPVHSEGDQPWNFFGRNDAKAEAPVLWPPHAKGWLIGKDSDAGRYWGQEEKGTTEDEMAGWHHWLNGHESEWTLGVGDGQGGLVCCNSCGCKESDTTEQLNWTFQIFLMSKQA